MPKPYQPPPIDWHQQPFLRTITAAKLLDCTPAHILNMVHDGRLDAITLPNVSRTKRHRSRYRIVTSSLLKAITQRVQA